MENFDINKIQLTIQTPGIKITEAMNDSIIIRIEKLGGIYPRVKKCEVLLQKEKANSLNKCFGEIKFFVPGKIIFSKVAGSTFKVVLDSIFEDLEDQLKRLMNKRAKEKKKTSLTSL